MITCVAANPSIDKVFEVQSLQRGGIHRPLALSKVPGGKAINVARAAATLDGEVEIVGFAGGHAGGWLTRELAAEDLRAKLVPAEAETRSCLSVLDRDRGSLTEFYEDGGAIDNAEWAALFGAVCDSLRPGGWLVISGSLPPGAPQDGCSRLLAAARGAGSHSALDARGSSLGDGLAKAPDLVKVNAAEAAELLGGQVRSSSEARRAVLRLSALASRPPVTVITRGRAGATMRAADGTTWQGSVTARGAFPVGSGDSFLAGLLVSREEGRDWPDAMRLALGAGAANAEVAGQGRLDRARAEELAALARIVEAIG